MTEDEGDFEASQYGTTDFDFAAVDPDDVRQVYRRATRFVEQIISGSRTMKAAQIRLGVASWLFSRKRESVSSLARKLKVSRRRIRQVADELSAFGHK